MKPARLMQLFAMIFLFCLATAQAQEPGATPAPTPELSAAKKALVKEILDLTNSRQASESMFTSQFDGIEKQMTDIHWQSISSMEGMQQLTPAQRDEVLAKIKESTARVSKRIKELFLKRIDMKQLVEDVSYATYDKHFTEAELTDLVAFYKSATGRKVIAEMPALFAESIQKAGEIIAPKVREIVAETQKDEANDITKEVELLIKTMPKTPPAKKKQAAVRRRH